MKKLIEKYSNGDYYNTSPTTPKKLEMLAKEQKNQTKKIQIMELDADV